MNTKNPTLALLAALLAFSGSIAIAEDPLVQVRDQGANGVCGADGSSIKGGKKLAAARVPSTGLTTEQRVEDLLKQMTLQEKCEYVGGENIRIRAIPRLGVPEIMMADGPLGFRSGNYQSTAYPAAVCGASTWNLDLLRRLGTAFGRDYRGRGFHIALAPGVNIIRDPRCGRNFEYYSEDPFLTGKMAAAQVQGMQAQGVLATLKHFACNSQETARNLYDAEIDERALHEIYLPGFRIAIVEAKAACVMNAFNKVNGFYCSSSGYLNNDILRNQWKFTGIVMSDWTGARDPVASMNGGLDLEMPYGTQMSPANIQNAIAAGTVAMATIDEKVRRLLRTIIGAGYLDREQCLPDISIAEAVTKDIPGSPEVALAVASEGVVLLKNRSQFLPLDPKRINNLVVLGRHAHPAILGGGGSSVMRPFRTISPFTGLQEVFPNATLVPVYPTIADVEKAPMQYDGPVKLELFKYVNVKNPKVAPSLVKEVNRIELSPRINTPGEDFPKDYSARFTARIKIGQGGLYTFVASANEGVCVYLDGKPIIDSWTGCSREFQTQGLVELEAGSSHELKAEFFTYSRGKPILRLGWALADAVLKAVEKAKAADAVIVCAGFDYYTEGESLDRTFGLDSFQQQLLERVTAANPKTAVVLFGGGAIDTKGWLENAGALLHAWYPGQEGGKAIAGILSGSITPSGKLPITIPRKIEDHPSHPFFLNKEHMAKNKAIYGEGVFVGYRGYDAAKKEPLFPFGYGLSYTSFAYEGLKVENGPGGTVNATFSVRNTGMREGSEAVQLYVAPPEGSVPRPPKELKGFAKVWLKPGESKNITIDMTKEAFAYWSPEKRDWIVDAGNYGILIGASSADIRLKQTIRVAAH